MPFLGTTPTQGFVGANPKQSFTANGSTTVFTLTNPVASANDLEVFVGNVRQEPTAAYTAAGTTLTMSEAPDTGLNFYVINKSQAQVTTTPPVNSISTDKIVNNAVTVGKLATSGTLPALNGSALTNSGGLKSVQVFYPNGTHTYTKPAGINTVKVICTGGGGGGAEGKSTFNYGGGGAAGGTAIDIIDMSSTSSVTVTVGAGGAQQQSGNGSAGNNGATSSFGSFCSATGGQGGQPEGGGNSRAAPGDGTGGVINILGGQGGSQGGGNTSDEATAGMGGSSFWGGGGTHAASNRDDQTGLQGQNGRAYGSGGGAGRHHSNGTFGYGGAGKDGIVYVEEYA